MCHLRISLDPLLPEVRLRVGEVGDLFAVCHNFWQWGLTDCLPMELPDEIVGLDPETWTGEEVTYEPSFFGDVDGSNPWDRDWEDFEDDGENPYDFSLVSDDGEMEPPTGETGGNNGSGESHIEQRLSENKEDVNNTWNSMFLESLSKSATPANHLQLPWETGVMKDIFNTSADPFSVAIPMPENSKFAEIASSSATAADAAVPPPEKIVAYYPRAVRNLADVEYFENKQAKLDLSCAKWCALLQHCTLASEVGRQIVMCYRKDPKGDDCMSMLKAVFGVKSPSTLLKRAGALKRYYKWIEENLGKTTYALPFFEPHVWEYFEFLDNECRRKGKGYTCCGEFLETVRFCKFMFGVEGCDAILNSRRLIGKSAILKSLKGPLIQAPALSKEQICRLHDILEHCPDLIDRVGAGCFLVALYARARWSDLRHIQNVEFDLSSRQGLFTLYTKEHKTAGVGLRREQFLPLIIPRHGIVHEDWLATFVNVYGMASLNLQRIPLGPLLPAPKQGGGWNVRPLTTTEAGDWLRSLLHGTDGCDRIRTHSLKATLCSWAAAEGFGKEVRAVLSHHSSALHGSDIIYSRNLQVQPIRKLQMMLKKVRLGLPDSKTAGRGSAHRVTTPPLVTIDLEADGPTVKTAEEEFEELEKEVRASGGPIDSHDKPLAETVGGIPVPKEIAAGLEAFEESSGSSSDASSYSDSNASSDGELQKIGPTYLEEAPQGMVLFKHCKSQILHKAPEGATLLSCGCNVSSKFVRLGKAANFKYPHCLKCFPKDGDRIRNVDQMVSRLDAAIGKAKSLKK